MQTTDEGILVTHEEIEKAKEVLVYVGIGTVTLKLITAIFRS